MSLFPAVYYTKRVSIYTADYSFMSPKGDIVEHILGWVTNDSKAFKLQLNIKGKLLLKALEHCIHTVLLSNDSILGLK